MFAVAGIARPDRFFTQLVQSGHVIAGSRAFPDHHVYGNRDLVQIASAAHAAGAGAVITTEKDAVRLERVAAGAGIPFLVVPLLVHIEPRERFHAWLESRLNQARAAKVATS